MAHFKSKKSNRVYAEKPLWTPIGRFAWVHLANPREQDWEGVTSYKYETTVCLQKDNVKVQSFEKQIEALVNTPKTGMLALLNQGGKTKTILSDTLLKDGDEDPSKHEKYPFQAGCFLVAGRSSDKKQPKVRNAKGELIDPSEIVGGMLGRMLVVPHVGTSGLAFRIEEVQLFKDDGVRFGGGTRDLSEFISALSEDGEECAVTPDTDSQDDAETDAVEEEIDQDVSEDEEALQESSEEEEVETEQEAEETVTIQTVTGPKTVKKSQVAGREKAAAYVAKASAPAKAPAKAPVKDARAIAAEQRASLAAKKSASKAGTVVTTGNGKNLALNNL